MRGRMLQALACLALAGCAHGGWGGSSGATAEASDRGWRALTTEHFVLHTDQADFMARQVLEEFERDVRVLQAVAFPSVTLPDERIDVVLMDTAQLKELSGDEQLGGFFRASDDVTRERHLLLLGVPNGGVLAGLGSLRRTVLHEMTHCFVRRAVPRAPAWLNEGLASYWETLELDTDSADVIVGRPPPLGVLVVDWAPLTELVEGDKARFYGRRDRSPAYASAWGAVHYLVEQRPAQLAAYEAALATGRDEASAWRNSFGVTAAVLDAQLRQLYAADQPLAHRMTRPALPVIEPQLVRPIEPAAVHLLWMRVADDASIAAEARMRVQLEAAERLAPAAIAVRRARAMFESTQTHWAEAGALLQQLAAEEPDDARLLFALAQVRIEQQAGLPPAERDDAALEALFAQLRATTSSASALALAARFEAARRGPDAALPMAESAVARNPDCVDCLVLLAAVRHARHDDDGAAEAEGRAVAAWPFERPPTRLLQLLATYRQARAAK